ncbi:MAG: hypothetical protein KatS3mg111_1539 [Pirellulaceae bacterium]|nr:MAG: hypothetical protein KatS3mg111_1539 [Pirellulaceae bacterium]
MGACLQHGTPSGVLVVGEGSPNNLASRCRCQKPTRRFSRQHARRGHAARYDQVPAVHNEWKWQGPPWGG